MAGGRIAVYVPEHPKANNAGYVLKSRWLMEQHLGHYLREDEVVHHKDGDMLNDALENLEVLSSSEHTSLHWAMGKKAGRERRLDYEAIRLLMQAGLGYRRIASRLNEPVYSVRHAVRQINLGV